MALVKAIGPALFHEVQALTAGVKGAVAGAALKAIRS
jgi:hypothetical protein